MNAAIEIWGVYFPAKHLDEPIAAIYEGLSANDEADHTFIVKESANKTRKKEKRGTLDEQRCPGPLSTLSSTRTIALFYTLNSYQLAQMSIPVICLNLKERMSSPSH